jgi:hypothetical protein
LPIPPYRGTSVPEIDYEAHPAYGGLFPKPTLRERIDALSVFLRTFAFVTIRRIVDYDNMPLLTKEADFNGLNYSTALRYISMYARIRTSRFLGTLTGCSVQAFADTATSVKRVREEQDPTQAAVASERAAQLHGLQILQRDIANQRHNFTRFVLVARTPAHYDPATPCKTSLIFTTRHEQGALVRCLNILADHGLNLTKIESRPQPATPWEYLFYVDVDGNVANPSVADALQAVQQHTTFFKMLGSYPARVRRSLEAASTLAQ